MYEESFVDEYRPVQSEYHKLLDQLDEMPGEKLVDRMTALIEKDPHYLDPYMILCERWIERGHLLKARHMQEQAYEKALELITNENGEWPAELFWGFHQNRHIIRAILNKAMMEWDDGNLEEALDILRKLLQSNPQDNVGARQFILAIRKGMTYTEFEERFNMGGFYNAEIIRWFNQHARDYPDDFDWWFKEMEEE